MFVLCVTLPLFLAVPLPSLDADAAPAAYASDYTDHVPAQAVVQSPSSQYHALGFRVAATNLPVHDVHAEPTVAAEQKVAPEVVVEPKPAMTPKIDYAYLPDAKG